MMGLLLGMFFQLIIQMPGIKLVQPLLVLLFELMLGTMLE